MSIELLGFVAGTSVILGAALALVSHEKWKAIRSAYGEEAHGSQGGNALIWPSR
jgi:hypothetical protein